MSITLPAGDMTVNELGPGFQAAVMSGFGILPGEDPVLSVALEGDGSLCVLRLKGVLGATSIAALETQIDQLGCMNCQRVCVDLSELTAIDGVGVKVLNGLHHYVQGRGGHLELVGALGQVADLLATSWS